MVIQRVQIPRFGSAKIFLLKIQVADLQVFGELPLGFWQDTGRISRRRRPASVQNRVQTLRSQFAEKPFCRSVCNVRFGGQGSQVWYRRIGWRGQRRWLSNDDHGRRNPWRQRLRTWSASGTALRVRPAIRNGNNSKENDLSDRHGHGAPLSCSDYSNRNRRLGKGGECFANTVKHCFRERALHLVPQLR